VSRFIRHPETKVSIKVQRNFKDITGQTINCRKVVGPSRRTERYIYYDVICNCGHRYEATAQTLNRSERCKQCAFKGERPYRRLRPYEAQYNVFKNRARHTVTLTYQEYYEIAKDKPCCHYCGESLVWNEWRPTEGRRSSASNLDRKDANLGYSTDNVVPCCGRCNYAKGTHFTYNQWREIGKVIAEWGQCDDYVVTPQSGSITRKETTQ